MEQNGTFSNEETIHAWADIVLKIWRAKITELQVWDTGALYASLLNTLTVNAGNNVSKVEFSFKLYGIFQDIGKTSEIFRGGKLSLKHERKEWYSRVFYREVMKLKDILIEKYGKAAVDNLILALRPADKPK